MDAIAEESPLSPALSGEPRRGAGVSVQSGFDLMSRHRVGEGKRILIVDDSRVVRNLLRHWLGRLGFTVIEAHNGPQGLAAIEGGDVDLVICDINMPGLTGLTILDRVRKDPSLRELPFVLLTTMGREEDVRRGEDLGCSAYLTKPILHGRLVSTLSRLLTPAPR